MASTSSPSTPPASPHTSLLPPQARSDYGKHRLFFRKSGKQRAFTTKTQLGFGAGVATSPEVRDATKHGPDEEAEEDQPLWELMRGNDTWAAGRMIMESLLQRIHGEAKASAAALTCRLSQPPSTSRRTCRPCLATALACGRCWRA